MPLKDKGKGLLLLNSKEDGDHEFTFIVDKVVDKLSSSLGIKL